MSPSTRNQALAALLFLYRDLLGMDLDLKDVVRARTRRRLPVVLTPQEVRAVLERMQGEEGLVAGLLYGSGLRVLEVLRLRVQDVDFGRREITVRDGKGGKDRRTLIPGTAMEQLTAHLVRVRRIHEDDLQDGYGRVLLPQALNRKYPNAAIEWAWQMIIATIAIGLLAKEPSTPETLWVGTKLQSANHIPPLPLTGAASRNCCEPIGSLWPGDGKRSNAQ